MSADEISPVPSAGNDWRVLIDAVPAPTMVLDQDFIVLHANALLTKLYPRARAGQHLAQFNRSPELLQAVTTSQSIGGTATIELIDRVPVYRCLSAVVTAISDHAIAAGGAATMITFRDETEQERLAQMRADFIAHASHELRTPLASLKGFIETLQGAAKNDPQARDRFLALMQTQADRMSRLIDDLLVLSRAEMQIHIPPRDAVDLNEVLTFTLQSLEPLASAKNIRLSAERTRKPAPVTGDREELIQVFQNLVQNAIKYGHEQGYVEMRIAELLPTPTRAPAFAVSIKDDGPGIADHHIPRLTERFYRVNPALSRQTGGTGLGLAIVKHILTRHAGELQIASELGQGSTFTVILAQRHNDSQNSAAHGIT